ncbi:pyruvate dehydrogenase (acetyl-transferring) E1 component subunit alpha [Haloplanus litoreus]|uniref:Pyruvate dehydrogenase (Acetyl-transferring) E1 component subunit alpha n=1 Tax=Haloplanus litoreus TaxID=767515 RepID=A0ABD6A1E8_9EURY
MTVDYDEGEFVRVLDEDGVPVDDDAVPDLDDGTLLGMYRDMRLTRHFDQRAINIQRQGRIGTFASGAGQEGAQVGSTYALADDDWILYQYREHGAVVVRDLDAGYLSYWMGHESGNATLADKHVFPLNITIADHLPHAVGMSWASKLKGDGRATVVHFGDGATSEGDFHEAMNFAGVFDTPTVFFCNNNGWAISVPVEKQTASATIAQKAAAYGMEGVRVDGMDPLACYKVTKEAVDRARDPAEDETRPTLIEAVTYRYGAHTTADDPSVYREDEEVERWKDRDPLERFESFLRRTERLDDDLDAEIRADIEDHVAAIIEASTEVEADPASMFDHAYADLPPELRRQRAGFLDVLDRYGDEAFVRD